MKRANGTGSISRASGNRRKPWVVRISYRDEYGDLRQRVLGTYATKKDAQLALDEYNAALRSGAAPIAERFDVTVGDVWTSWSKKKKGEVSKSRWGSISAAWTKRVSVYSERKMRSIGADEWQALVDKAVSEGASKGVVDNVVVLCHALCKYAMERDIIGKDYSQFMKAPAIAPKVEKGAFSQEQIGALAQMAADGVPWADTVLMLVYTGFRVDEFLELRPSDYRPDYGGYFTGGSKTDAGRDRIVPVHPRIASYVEKWLAAGGAYLVFSEPTERIKYETYLRRFFVPVVQALGLPQATPHWCRHTFASMAHSAHMDELTVKWIMGHATDRDITHHYTHAVVEEICTEMRKIP